LYQKASETRRAPEWGQGELLILGGKIPLFLPKDERKGPHLGEDADKSWRKVGSDELSWGGGKSSSSLRVAAGPVEEKREKNSFQAIKKGEKDLAKLKG